MLKKTIIVILCLILTSPLTSCYDANEIDDIIHVVTVGIDNGVSDKWRLTIQFSTMSQSSSGGSESGMSKGSSGGGNEGEQKGYSFVTIEAPSFFAGVNLLNSSIPGNINFMHTHFLVFSEDLAKSGKIGEFIAPIIRYREIRRTLHVMVTKGTAMEFVKENKPYIGSSLSKNMHQMTKETAKTGFFTHSTLHDYYICLKSNYEQPICTLVAINDFSNFKEEGKPFGDEYKTDGYHYAGDVPRQGGNKIEFLGTAVFNGDKMVGELNGDETRLLLMTTGDFKQAFITIPDPLKPELIVPLDVRRQSKPKINVTFENGKPIITVNIELEGDLLAVQSRIKYENATNKEILEKSFEEYIKSGLDELINKCQDFDSDVFRFGRVACKQFITIQEWENYSWNKHFKDADVTTNVNFVIRRTGSQLDSSEIEFSGGENK